MHAPITESPSKIDFKNHRAECKPVPLNAQHNNLYTSGFGVHIPFIPFTSLSVSETEWGLCIPSPGVTRLEKGSGMCHFQDPHFTLLGQFLR